MLVLCAELAGEATLATALGALGADSGVLGAPSLPEFAGAAVGALLAANVRLGAGAGACVGRAADVATLDGAGSPDSPAGGTPSHA